MNYQFLSRTALFCGIQPEEMKTMLSCLTAEAQTYEKGEMIYRAGDAAASLGVVLEGKVLIEHDDIWGNTTVLDSVLPGQIFAETYACTPGEPLMVNVEAAEESQILFLNVSRVLRSCTHACAFHEMCIRDRHMGYQPF